MCCSLSILVLGSSATTRATRRDMMKAVPIAFTCLRQTLLYREGGKVKDNTKLGLLLASLGFYLAVSGFIVWVIVHFIRKFW